MSSEGKDQAESRPAANRPRGGEGTGARPPAPAGAGTGFGWMQLRPTMLALSSSVGVHLVLFGVAMTLVVAVPQPIELLRVTLRSGGGSGDTAQTRGPGRTEAGVAVVAKPAPEAVAKPRPPEAKPERRERPRQIKAKQRKRVRRAAAPVVERHAHASESGREDDGKTPVDHTAVDAAAMAALGSGAGRGVARGGGAGGGEGRGLGSGRGGGTNQRAYCVYCPEPTYPLIARRRGWEGTVDIGLLVRADGRVDSARVRHSSGYEPLDRAAVEVARISRFNLPRDGVRPAPLRGRIEYRFVLR